LGVQINSWGSWKNPATNSKLASGIGKKCSGILKTKDVKLKGIWKE